MFEKSVVDDDDDDVEKDERLLILDDGDDDDDDDVDDDIDVRRKGIEWWVKSLFVVSKSNVNGDESVWDDSWRIDCKSWSVLLP